MTVIARCEGCGYEYLVRPDRTVSLACDCPLRDPDTPWSVVEMVPAEQLRGAVAALEEIARCAGEDWWPRSMDQRRREVWRVAQEALNATRGQ